MNRRRIEKGGAVTVGNLVGNLDFPEKYTDRNEREGRNGGETLRTGRDEISGRVDQ